MTTCDWWAESRCYSVKPNEQQIHTLLNRKPHPLPLSALGTELHGAKVLVTGAGGFIGSEICHALAKLGARIIAVDSSEYALASLGETLPAGHLTLALADIRDRVRVSDLLKSYRPSHAYHAAAYKHVPFLEAFLFEAVENNVLATFDFAQACAAFGVGRFVFVSSDKAASARNVLGMTKRMAEILVSSMPEGRATFASVRCANVLGSPGSVLPRAIDQISRGGPVTLTGECATRYFISLEEAAHAILYSGHLPGSGEIFIPNPGEPVRVKDLLTRLIGSRPIRLHIAGLRPGDQQHELLSSDREDAVLTDCGKLRVIRRCRSLEPDERKSLIRELRVCCTERDEQRLRNCVQSFLSPFV